MLSKTGVFIKSIAIYYILIPLTIGVEHEISVIRLVEDLKEIKLNFTNSFTVYKKERINEINKLIGNAASKWDFIKGLNDIESWWYIDINYREDFIFTKLSTLLEQENVKEAFNELKKEYSESLSSAENFWHQETDKNLENLRKNPQIFTGLIREPIFTTEHPPLKLPSEHQSIYEDQMRNLTNIANITKDIVKTTLEEIVPKLPNINDISYFSKKAKFEMIISILKRNENLLIDSTRIFATERVSGDWRIQGKNGPTKEEFDKEYIKLSKYATNVIRNLNKTIKQNMELKLSNY